MSIYYYRKSILIFQVRSSDRISPRSLYGAWYRTSRYPIPFGSPG